MLPPSATLFSPSFPPTRTVRQPAFGLRLKHTPTLAATTDSNDRFHLSGKMRTILHWLGGAAVGFLSVYSSLSIVPAGKDLIVTNPITDSRSVQREGVFFNPLHLLPVREYEDGFAIRPAFSGTTLDGKTIIITVPLQVRTSFLDTELLLEMDRRLQAMPEEQRKQTVSDNPTVSKNTELAYWGQMEPVLSSYVQKYIGQHTGGYFLPADSSIDTSRYVAEDIFYGYEDVNGKFQLGITDLVHGFGHEVNQVPLKVDILGR